MSSHVMNMNVGGVSDNTSAAAAQAGAGAHGETILDLTPALHLLLPEDPVLHPTPHLPGTNALFMS